MKDVFEQVSMRNVINFLLTLILHTYIYCFVAAISWIIPTFYCSSIALILHHFLYSLFVIDYLYSFLLL